MPEHIPYLRVFLSSPGDVNEERKIVQDVIERLPYRPALRDRVAFRIIAWDKLGADTPMLGSVSPQAAIDLGLPKPSECDISIVIFWSRMGTPFIYNDTQYLSGTHYELMDSLSATGTETLIFRRNEIKLFTAGDKRGQEQYEKVEEFFQSDLFFDHERGVIRRGVNIYSTPDEFRQRIETYLEDITLRQLKRLETASIKRDTSDVIAPALAIHVREVRPERWQGSPFPGLRAFMEDDAPIYFGRGVETDALVKCVTETRFVTVVGASGSGKSSLVGAGLIPRLRANAISGPELGSKDWLYVRFTPGSADSPFAALFDGLVETFSALRPSPLDYSRTRHAFVQELERDPKSLLITLDQALKASHVPAWAEVLLFIDQFEELLTLADTHSIAPFVQLLQAAAASSQVRIVVTLRADFYARAVEIQGLADLLKESTYPLAAPSPVVLYEMVVRPADMAGLSFEEGLVDRILRETGTEPGALALLAYLLDELYNKGADDGLLSIAEYEALGGVRGAIGKRAEEVVSKLPAETQAALPHLFREIVEVDARGRATRRRALLSRLNETALHPALKALTQARLFVTDEGESRAATLEVAHEALLREWERLAAWITEAQADLLLRRQIEQAAQDWQAAPDDQKNAYVLVGGRLIEAQRWAQTQAAGAVEQDFIEASTTHQTELQAQDERIAKRAQNLGRAAAAFAVIGILAIFLTVYAFVQTNQAQEALGGVPPTLTYVAQVVQAGEQIQESLRLATIAETELSHENSTIAVLLGIRSLQSGFTVPAYSVLMKALDQNRARIILKNVFESDFFGWDVVYSPDGRFFVTTGAPFGETNIWDARTNEKIQFLGGAGRAYRPAFSPDSHFIAVEKQVDGQLYVQIWDIDKGEQIGKDILSIGRYASYSFSPDGNHLLVPGYDALEVWDVETTQQIQKISGDQTFTTSYTDASGNEIQEVSHALSLTGINSITYSPDGKWIFAASQDGNFLRLIDSETGQRSRNLSAFGASFGAFSPDSHYLLTMDPRGGGSITVHDIYGQEESISLTSHSGAVNTVNFSSDGKYFVSAGNDSIAIVWDVLTWKPLYILDLHTDGVASAVFSPDNQSIITMGYDGTAIIWDIIPRQYSQVIEDVEDGAFNFDGSLLVTTNDTDKAIIWDTKSLQQIKILSLPDAQLNEPKFSPDGLKIFTTNKQNGSIILWDMASDQPSYTFVLPADELMSPVFSSDGRVMATVGKSSQNILIWNLETKEYISFSSGGATSDLSLSADGASLLATDGQGVFIWNTLTKERILSEVVFASENTGTFPLDVSSIAYSTNGNFIIIGTRNAYGFSKAYIWDAHSYKEVGTLLGEGGSPVSDAIYSPDNLFIATVSAGKIVLWDAATRQKLRLLGATQATERVRYSANGRFIMGIGTDGLQIWEVGPTYFADFACQQIRDLRDFTSDERAQYELGYEPTCPQFANGS